MRSLPIFVAVTFAEVLAVASANAEESVPLSMSSPRAMTLSEAISYAKAHQPAVLSGIARVAAQEKAARVPRAQWFPSFGASAQLFGATANNSSALYVTDDPLDIPRIGGTPSTVSSWQPYGSTFVGGGARQ